MSLLLQTIRSFDFVRAPTAHGQDARKTLSFRRKCPLTSVVRSYQVAAMGQTDVPQSPSSNGAQQERLQRH